MVCRVLEQQELFMAAPQHRCQRATPPHGRAPPSLRPGRLRRREQRQEPPPGRQPLHPPSHIHQAGECRRRWAPVVARHRRRRCRIHVRNRTPIRARTPSAAPTDAGAAPQGLVAGVTSSPAASYAARAVTAPPPATPPLYPSAHRPSDRPPE
ncbi:hypothetical protein I4F81_010648 [Pyropia yezoensis]|uniref:Uncharacterized protein n=1 Tax=Pyropia yezoensis TaxID=2788 RepID=A0ACC3CDA5_PYRYE|nr:hypothetical protein I4F81_010648 [Neopyropia yezoensis]